MALAQNGSWGVISPNRTIYAGQMAGVYLTSGAGNRSTAGLTGVLQQVTSKGWVTVGNRKIDSKGRAAFLAKPSASASFRVYVKGNAFIASSYTNTIRINVSNKGVAIVAAAAKHKGKMYQYGAAGPHRFDCSGFTQYVFKQFGRKLPHSATQQARMGTYVAKNAAKPGDLVFFGKSGGYYHTGIYAGNGKMWDSPTSGQAVGLRKIWSNTYTVRRLV
jgi:cell wall-associated NlpC family hydrolase